MVVFMRRILAGLAAALVVVALGATPAFAVEPPAPPVLPAQTLPSTFSRAAGTGSGLMDNQVKLTAFMLQQLRARAAAGATAAVVADAAPITAGGALSSTATGGLVTAGFMGGWLITDGTLALYAHTTGTDPMAGTCSQPEWAQAAIGLLYPFSSPDCTVTFTTPNEGVTGGYSPLSYGGLTITYKGSQVLSPGNTRGCYTVGGTVPSGYKVMVLQYDGGWTSSVPGSTPTVCLPLGGTHFNFLGEPARPSGPATPYSYFIFPTSTTTGYSSATATAKMNPLSADPGRIPRCDLTWPDGSHSVTTGASYHESAGLPLNSFQSLCNEGFVSKPGHGPALLPTGIEIGSTNEDTGAYTEISDQPVPDFTETERKGLEPGTMGGLVLQKVIGTAVSSCMNWDADCGGWWDDTESGTVPTTDTGTYRCLFNGSPVDLDECGIYRRTFDEQTSTPTITEPSTGTQTPWLSAPDTNSPNSTSPGSGPTPGDACFASWPSAPDPISWVMHPVKCALVWAFVPRAAKVQESQDAIQASIDETIVGTTATALAGLGAAFDSGVGCGGLPIHIEGFGVVLVHAYILESCTEPAAGIAATVRTILSVAIIIGGILALTRYLGSLFGFQSFGRNHSENKSGVSFQ